MQRAKGTDRILDILAFFENHREAVTRNALALALECPRSTVYILVDQLLERGWLWQNPDGTVRLGYRAGLLGLTYACQDPFENIARDVVQRVAADTGEVAELNIAENWQQLVLVSASGRGKTYLRLFEGSRSALPLTASARVQLMGISEHRLKSQIPAGDFITGDGLTLPFRHFLRDIIDANQRGYSVVQGLLDPFIGAVALPVKNPLGDCLAAMSVVLPAPQLNKKLQELVGILQEAVAELEQQLRINEWPLGETARKELLG